MFVDAQRQQDSLRKCTVVLQKNIYKVNIGCFKILQYCEMGSIDIPLRSGSLDMLRMSGESFALDTEREDLEDSQHISNDTR